MVTRLADLFPIILVTAVTSLSVSPLAIRLATLFGLVDMPGSAPHKSHTKPIPMVGGIVLTIAILVGYLVLRPPINHDIAGIIIGACVIAVVGIIDDRIDLPPYQKLIGQATAAIVLILFHVQVRMTRVVWLDLLFTVIWLIGLTNAFNFVDSQDGLAIGLAGIAAAFFMLVTIDSSQPVLSTLAASIFGASAGAFYFNAVPARIFLGDSGSQFLGFLLAALGLAYVPAQAGLPQGVSWFTPILVLGVPIFDMTLVVVSRLKNRKPIYLPGKDHTYHRLLKMGLDSTRSVLTMQFAAAMLGLIAFIALDASVLAANLIFAVIVFIGVGMIYALDRAS